MIRWLLQPSILWPLIAGAMLLAVALMACGLAWLVGVLVL